MLRSVQSMGGINCCWFQKICLMQQHCRMQTSFCFPQKKWRTLMRKLNTISPFCCFSSVCSWADGQFYVAGHRPGRKVLAWIGVGIFGGAHRPWSLPTAQIFRASRYGGKPYGSRTLCSGQGVPVGLPFCLCSFPYWCVRQSAERRIHSVSVHNGPALLTQLLLVASVFVHLLPLSGLFWYRWALSGIRNSAATSI